MSKLNCIVIDDDPISRDVIRNCVERVEFLHLIGSYGNALEGRMALERKPVDLIFLDVEMPEMSGLEFLETFRDVPQVIIVTSGKKYAYEAYKYDVTDFLAKPINMERFIAAAERARYYEDNLIGNQEDNHLFVKANNALTKIRVPDIDYVEAMGDYIKVVTSEKSYIVHSTMKAFIAKLPEKAFLRVHKSYILNLNKVVEIVDGYAIGEHFNLPVSRAHRKTLKDRMFS